MTKRQIRQVAMFVCVRDFGNVYKEKFPEGSEGSKAFAAVTAVVAEVDGLLNTKLTAKRVSSGSKEAARQVLMGHIAAIARSARVLATATPGADERFPLPERKGDFAVLQGGRLFLQEAAPVKDSLIRCGLSPTFLDDLQQSVASFERHIGIRSEGRSGAAVSRDGIRARVKKGIETVRSLDALVLNVLGQDDKAMSRWKRDRHVDMTGKNASNGTRDDRPSEPPVATEPSVPSATAVINPPLPLEKAS